MLDDDLRDVASRHARELRSRTDRDRRRLEERQAEVTEIERRLAAQEWLLKLLGEQPPVPAKRAALQWPCRNG